jgi:hypothetical protein
VVGGVVPVIRMLIGGGVAMFGFLLVMDQLSLRDLLGETGPAPALRLARAIHAVVEHPGAQVAELTIGLIGLMYIALSIRSLWRSTAQRRHSA